ncbi:hypothetical protein JCM9279_001366 [Rhodotorula babjevae]
MADDRFSYLNLASASGHHLLDEDDERRGWDLPDDDIRVPLHLLPPYQDEEDDAVLPSQAHPSYPYGNPYKPHLSSTLRRGPASSSSSSSSRPTADPSTHAASLATALPALELRDLYERTTFGDAPDRQWRELHLGGLFGRRTRPERDEDEDERDTHGDAGPPAGQNAGDAPEDDSEGDMDDGSQDGVVVP